MNGFRNRHWRDILKLLCTHTVGYMVNRVRVMMIIIMGIVTMGIGVMRIVLMRVFMGAEVPRAMIRGGNGAIANLKSMGAVLGLGSRVDETGSDPALVSSGCKEAWRINSALPRFKIGLS
jgi:hypothetical protein